VTGTVQIRSSGSVRSVNPARRIEFPDGMALLQGAWNSWKIPDGKVEMKAGEKKIVRRSSQEHPRSC
jgi:hypothetical protein